MLLLDTLILRSSLLDTLIITVVAMIKTRMITTRDW